MASSDGVEVIAIRLQQLGRQNRRAKGAMTIVAIALLG